MKIYIFVAVAVHESFGSADKAHRVQFSNDKTWWAFALEAGSTTRIPFSLWVNMIAHTKLFFWLRFVFFHLCVFSDRAKIGRIWWQYQFSLQEMWHLTSRNGNLIRRMIFFLTKLIFLDFLSFFFITKKELPPSYTNSEVIMKMKFRSIKWFGAFERRKRPFADGWMDGIGIKCEKRFFFSSFYRFKRK